MRPLPIDAHLPGIVARVRERGSLVLVADPALRGVGTVLLDEFHERHLQGDLALALLHRLRRGERPGLRLGAMSATLEAEPLARLLDADLVSVPGRLFPVAVEHLDRGSLEPRT